MLKPISQPFCSGSLNACQAMMKRLALWLCDPATNAASITEAGLQPPTLASAIEATWLWDFLQRSFKKKYLLSHAQALANLPPASKVSLIAWINTVSALTDQFQPAPAAWTNTCPLVNKTDWDAFKNLMEAFYEVGFKVGLPYLANGTPTATGGVTYADYVKAFRDAHRLNPNPDAHEVCVFCGGQLGDTPHVDHWIIKSKFPLLSVCADNLTLICNTCNEAPNKGTKLVFNDNNSFVDWFHPYLRPASTSLSLTYHLQPDISIKATTSDIPDQPKIVNIDELLNLSKRWTTKFKAEYLINQDVMRRRELDRLSNGEPRHTLADIQAYVNQYDRDLVNTAPDYEVRLTLSKAMKEPARQTALLSELALVTI